MLFPTATECNIEHMILIAQFEKYYTPDIFLSASDNHFDCIIVNVIILIIEAF